MKHAGLTMKQAQQRLAQDGENTLQKHASASIAALFFAQCKDVMIFILAAATIISLVMGQTTEAVTILAIVLLNAVLGVVQEYKTEKTLEALIALSAPSATVLRDGKAQPVPAAQLVTEDIILLEARDKVPADGVLLEGVQLQCDEAFLTGESAHVAKAAGDKVYMGASVLAGNGVARITATSMRTEMGRIANMLQETETAPTPLQKRLKQLGGFVAAACIVTCFAVAGVGFLQGGAPLEMLLTGVSLAVAAIPEGLPAIVTITLALSTTRILKKGAVIRRLHAVETLGCAGVICSDKTGTITQNKMTVQQVWLPCYITTQGGKNLQSRLLQCAALCSNATATTGDAMEQALLAALGQYGVPMPTQQRLEEVPFSAERKRMSVVVRTDKGALRICKGAPDVLLPLCAYIATPNAEPLTQAHRVQIQAKLTDMAQHAYRVLAVAVSDAPAAGERSLTLLGIIALQDPPRPQVKAAVRKCRTAGIKPVMITGDYAPTAVAVASQVGIYRAGDKVLTGTELDAMTAQQLAAVCMRTSVYARVNPEHKLRIVAAYQAAGQVTAMTGDGVNDAPAVKAADIGVAMGQSGTDVTKEAAAVVVLDDDFATIISAVEEGRVIYQNIRRFVRYLLTSNLGEVLGMVFAMILGLPVMLQPILILLVNLFTDGLPAIALGMEPPAKGIMQRPPRPRNESLFAHGLMRTILVRGTMLGMASCGAYWAALLLGSSLEVARSACFLTIVFSQMLHIFECRGGGFSMAGNRALRLATSASAGFTALIVYVPFLQSLFGTQPVLGAPLCAVFVAVVAGPILAAGARLLRKWLYKRA